MTWQQLRHSDARAASNMKPPRRRKNELPCCNSQPKLCLQVQTITVVYGRAGFFPPNLLINTSRHTSPTAGPNLKLYFNALFQTSASGHGKPFGLKHFSLDLLNERRGKDCVSLSLFIDVWWAHSFFKGCSKKGKWPENSLNRTCATLASMGKPWPIYCCLRQCGVYDSSCVVHEILSPCRLLWSFVLSNWMIK